MHPRRKGLRSGSINRIWSRAVVMNGWTAFAAGLTALGLAACAPQPPAELSGLWAQGPGGCEAQAGIVFAADAVRISASGASEVLFADPLYMGAPDGEGLAITIRYTARRGLLGPRQTGELALYRDGEGWLRLIAHRTADGRQGYARMRAPDADPLASLFRTQRCGADAWIGGLRGRPDARPVAENKGAAGREPGGAVAGTGGGEASPPPAVGAQLRGRAAVLQEAS